MQASHPPITHDRSERVVLWRNVLFVKWTDDGHLLHNVYPYARDVGEEEKSSDAGGDTEGG